MRRTTAIAIGSLVSAACGVRPQALNVSSPKIVSVVPGDGATGVPPDSQMVVCFDLPLDPQTVTSAQVLLSRDDGHQTQALAATVSLSADGTCLTIWPASALSPSSHYRLELEKGLHSASGVEISSKAVAFSSFFTTQAPAALVCMSIPTDGMLAAPLDLSQVLLSFSAPVGVLDGGAPFSVSPGTAQAVLSPDGRSASVPFPVAASGTAIEVQLSAALFDPSGQLPSAGGPLGFTMGGCSESNRPSLGEGLVLARDTDGLLSFAVDRPSLCGASVEDSACPDAGGLSSPAECQSPYDPCQASSLCLCTVALVGLCPGHAAVAIPKATGFDGQLGSAPPVSFSANAKLPALVLTEIRGGSKGSAFIEVQNRGAEAVDLLGLGLADCALTLGCAFPKSIQIFGPLAEGGSTALAPNGYALLIDPTFDDSPAPSEVLLLSPQARGSLLSLSETHAQSLALFAPDWAAPLSTFDGSVLPKSGASLERIDPGAPDVLSGNWSLSTASGGTPGACNSVTSGPRCDASLP